MPVTRLTQNTKHNLQIVKKEILQLQPELNEMTLSENYIIARMIRFYMLDSIFKDELQQ